MSANATPLRFVVVTGSEIESGTILAYLLESTGLNVTKVYHDTMELTSRRVQEAPSRWFNDRGMLGRHLGLCGAMPRHYLFEVLRKCLGLTELKLLSWLERVSPSLMRRACGFPVPLQRSARPLLRTMSQVVAEHGIPLLRTPSLNSDETIAGIAADRPDVVIGLGTRILSGRLLATARLGFLNAHASLLPDYRGGATEFWQLANGERTTGVTIHWMAPRVDEGPLCAQRSWPIPAGFDHHRLRLMSLFYSLDLWREVVERLLRGEVPRLPQSSARTLTFKAPTMQQQYDFYCRRVPPTDLAFS